MSLALRAIRHQVWTDSRGLALYLAAWFVVLAIQVGVVAVGPAEVPRVTPRLESDVVAIVMRVLLTVALVVLVIQRDAGIGTTAFWRTRPMPPLAMWTAKSVWILLFLVLVPSAAMGMLWLALGLAPAEALYGAVLIMLDQCIVAGVAMMAAALTATVAHFVVAVAAGMAVYVALMTTMSKVLRDVPAVVETASSIGPATLLSGVLFVGGLVVLASQYVTRREAQSAVSAVVVLVAATLGMALVRAEYRMPEPPRAPVNRALLNPESISLTLVPASIREQPLAAVMGNPTPRVEVAASIQVAGAPPYAVFQTLDSSSILRIPGHADIRWQSRKGFMGGTGSLMRQPTPDDQPFRSTRIALGEPEFIINFGARGLVPRLVLASVAADLIRSGAVAGVSLDADVTLRAYRQVVRAAVPLKSGQSVRVGTHRWTIETIQRVPGGVAVTLRGPNVMPIFWYLEDANVSLVLRNRAKGQAILVTRSRSRAFGANFASMADRVSNVLERHEFLPGPDVMSRFGLNAQWLADADLVWVGQEELGTFTRPLRAPSFTLGAPPLTQPPG